MPVNERLREHRARTAAPTPSPSLEREGSKAETDDRRHHRQRAIALYDRFTHEGMERRAFMGEMAKIAGSAAAAELLIAGIAASPAAAAIVAEDDRRLTTRVQTLVGNYRAYVAEPRTRSLKPTVLVIHENRGLNAHTRDVARRLALANFRAVAVDFLSPVGGTPGNEDAAREAIGKLDLGRAVSDAVAMLDELARSSRGGKVGAVGFCWGGAFVNRLAVAAGDKLDAGVVYYGPRLTWRRRRRSSRPWRSTSPASTSASTAPASRGSPRFATPARRYASTSTKAPTTRSTTTPRRSATASPPPTSHGAEP
jgi:carboxymethylenebutenolidase